MEVSVFFSPRVISTINSLPDPDRKAVASALTGEFILGMGASTDLTPLQNLALAVIRQYVRRDTARVAWNIRLGLLPSFDD